MEQKTKSPEQLRYFELCAESKKLYHIQKSLDDIQASMSQGNDAASMMQMGYRLHQAMHGIREMADSKYHQKLKLEAQRPEFKAEAQAYGKEQKQKRQQSQEQSF